jgi:short-subunit dehydrogenase
MMDSEVVTQIGIEAMLKGRSSVVSGRFNALMALMTRFVPRSLAADFAYRTMTVM